MYIVQYNHYYDSGSMLGNLNFVLIF